MNSKTLLGGIEGNFGNEINNIDLVMAFNTQVTQDHNNNNYELCVDSIIISKNGEFKQPSIDIDHYVEEDRWDYSNECSEWEGGGIRNNYEPKQNRMLENYVCNDTTRNDEVANILLSLNRKNKLDNPCNDKKDKNGEGGNKGDINYQLDADVKMSARELGKENIGVAEKCGVDDCDGQLVEHSQATIDINNHECNVITDTEDDIGIIFQLEGEGVKVSIRDFGSCMKFNKECYHKGYKNGEVNTYLTAKLFAASAAGQKWHRLKSMIITGRYKKKG
jgi:hypothetical protein